MRRVVQTTAVSSQAGTAIGNIPYQIAFPITLPRRYYRLQINSGVQVSRCAQAGAGVAEAGRAGRLAAFNRVSTDNVDAAAEAIGRIFCPHELTPLQAVRAGFLRPAQLRGLRRLLRQLRRLWRIGHDRSRLPRALLSPADSARGSARIAPRPARSRAAPALAPRCCRRRSRRG